MIVNVITGLVCLLVGGVAGSVAMYIYKGDVTTVIKRLRLETNEIIAEVERERAELESKVRKVKTELNELDDEARETVKEIIKIVETNE